MPPAPTNGGGTDWPAWGALLVAAAAFLHSVWRSHRDRTEREKHSKEDRELREALARDAAASRDESLTLFRRLVEAAERDREGERAAQPPAPGPKRVELGPAPEHDVALPITARGGAPSVLVVRIGTSGRRPADRVVIANTGLGTAHLLKVEQVSKGGWLIPDAVGFDESDPHELRPGEEYSFLIALAMGDEHPLKLKLYWRDSTGEHEREFRLNP